LLELGEKGLVSQPLLGGLGNAEVDHLGNRLVAVQRHQDIGRFNVAVNDPLLVRVLDRRANFKEQSQL